MVSDISIATYDKCQKEATIWNFIILIKEMPVSVSLLSYS